MSKILIFGLGVICGMVGLMLLLFIYVSLRANDIDKR